MNCKLCLKVKPLIKKSHIIPNFMYKGLFGKTHKLVNVNLSNFSDREYRQTGFFDKNILCAQCDNEIIGKLERYASNTIYADKLQYAVIKEQFDGDGIAMPYIRYQNLDYTKVKLFLLSLLWRAHISKESFFREVNLSRELAEKIRKMIYNADGGLEDELEVILFLIDAGKIRPTKSIIEPRFIAGEGACYIFHINEIMYHFNIATENKQAFFDKGIIKRDGIMDIAILTEDDRDYFDSFIGKPLLLKGNPKI
jgi:hypothetical protein